MSQRIFIEVHGFTDVERHALNRMFALSEERLTKFSLWIEGAPEAARVILVDGQSGVANELLGRMSATRDDVAVIWVGPIAPARAALTLQRPIAWSNLISKLDQMFTAQSSVDFDLDGLGGSEFGDVTMPGQLPESTVDTDTQPGTIPGALLPLGAVEPRVLLLDPVMSDRLYLRSKLASLGTTQVDEAADVDTAEKMLAAQSYSLVIAHVAENAAVWGLIEGARFKKARVIVTTQGAPKTATRMRAWNKGCAACMAKPLDPYKLAEVLQRL
jgi:CheY-like chemotaxis protein